MKREVHESVHDKKRRLMENILNRMRDEPERAMLDKLHKRLLDENYRR